MISTSKEDFPPVPNQKRLKSSLRSGHGAIEVSIVILLAFLLLSLILPIIHLGRNSAQLVSCKNNLRQIGLALEAYLNIHGSYPAGSVNESGPITNEKKGFQWGWTVQLLPQMEHQGTYNALEKNLSIYKTYLYSDTRIQVPVYRCPTSILDQKSYEARLYPEFSRAISYAGCHHHEEAPIDVSNQGVMILNRCIKPADIEDGFEYTVIIGEKFMAPDELGWMTGTKASLRNASELSLVNPYLDNYAPDKIAVGGFGSYHPRSISFLFCSGTVRGISPEIDRGIFRSLAHRSDGGTHAFE